MRNVFNVLRGLYVALLMGLPAVTSAQEAAAEPQIVVEQPWARASVGTSRPGAAYLVLRNEGDTPVSLTGLQSDVAAMSEVHETKTDDKGVSSMSPAGDIEIPAGESVALEPGGYHAMLMKLQEPLVEGETFSMKLTFSDGAEMDVDIPVLSAGASGPEE